MLGVESANGNPGTAGGDVNLMPLVFCPRIHLIMCIAIVHASSPGHDITRYSIDTPATSLDDPNGEPANVALYNPNWEPTNVALDDPNWAPANPYSCIISINISPSSRKCA